MWTRLYPTDKPEGTRESLTCCSSHSIHKHATSLWQFVLRTRGERERLVLFPLKPPHVAVCDSKLRRPASPAYCETTRRKYAPRASLCSFQHARGGVRSAGLLAESDTLQAALLILCLRGPRLSISPCISDSEALLIAVVALQGKAQYEELSTACRRYWCCRMCARFIACRVEITVNISGHDGQIRTK